MRVSVPDAPAPLPALDLSAFDSCSNSANSTSDDSISHRSLSGRALSASFSRPSISSLPFEILVRICSFLSTNDLLSKLSVLSHSFRATVLSRAFWRSISLQNASINLSRFHSISSNHPIALDLSNCHFDRSVTPTEWDTFLSNSAHLKSLRISSPSPHFNAIALYRSLLQSKTPDLQELVLKSQGQAQSQTDYKFVNKMGSLRVLHLNRQKLTHFDFVCLIELIAANPNLTEINLAGTCPVRSLAQSLLIEICKLARLTLLSLSNWTFFDEHVLQNCIRKNERCLSHLSLRNVQLSSLSAISALDNLTHLNLSYVQKVDDEFLYTIAHSLVQLSTLKLNGCQITSHGVKHLTTLPLRELCIAETKIDSRALDLLSSARGLVKLDISHNFIENMVENLKLFLAKNYSIKYLVIYGYESLVTQVATSHNIHVFH